jgi:exodeoxyribonuclease-3
MKIATFNINGIRSRLASLLVWLEREQPDVACLQELKAPDSGFPAAEIRAAGYGAIWHGQTAWNGVAILAKGATPVETRRGLPGGDADAHSRYLEADIEGLRVGCLYLPNGNPQPGPKFDYKLEWFERLIAYANTLYTSGQPVVLAGDYNVVPTDFDIYNTRSWLKDALLQPESRACYARLIEQGWTDALRTQFPQQKIYTFWDYFRRHWETNSGLRIDHLLLSKPVAAALRGAGVDTWVRGEPHASDHAPAWIELDLTRAVTASARGKTPRAAAQKTAAKTAPGAAKKTVARKTSTTASKTGAKTAAKTTKKTAAKATTKTVTKTDTKAAAKTTRKKPAGRAAATTTRSATKSASASPRKTRTSHR